MCYRIGQGLLLLLSQRNIPLPPSQGGLVYTTKKRFAIANLSALPLGLEPRTL